jgi:hypothetical protein
MTLLEPAAHLQGSRLQQYQHYLNLWVLQADVPVSIHTLAQATGAAIACPLSSF